VTEDDVEMSAGNDPAAFGEDAVEARTGVNDGPEAGTPPTPGPGEPELHRDQVPDSSR
jgi:hypothetical protein